MTELPSLSPQTQEERPSIVARESYVTSSVVWEASYGMVHPWLGSALVARSSCMGRKAKAKNGKIRRQGKIAAE